MGDSNDVAVMFDTAFASLEKTLAARLDGDLRAEFRLLGVDFTRLQPAYPMETWEAGLELVWRACFRELTREEAWRRIGREFMQGYVQTPLGAARLLMGRALGVRRMMHRMGRNFRTASNTSTVTATDVSDGVVDVVIAMEPQFLQRWKGQALSLPHHRLGILEGTLEVLRVDGAVTLTQVDRELQRTGYRVSWR